MNIWQYAHTTLLEVHYKNKNNKNNNNDDVKKETLIQRLEKEKKVCENTQVPLMLQSDFEGNSASNLHLSFQMLELCFHSLSIKTLMTLRCCLPLIVWLGRFAGGMLDFCCYLSKNWHIDLTNKGKRSAALKYKEWRHDFYIKPSWWYSSVIACCHTWWRTASPLVTKCLLYARFLLL